MAVKTIRHAGNLGTAQTENIWSAGIWHDCPLDAIKSGDIPGRIWEFLFDTLPITPPTTEGNFGDFAAFTSTGGFINAGTGGGWNVGSDGDNEGVGIRTRATPWKIARTTKKLWYELRMKDSTIADTKHGFIHGLIEDVAFTATVPIAAAGTLADQNFVGIHRLEGDGDNLDTVYKANGVTQVTVKADASVLVADTYFKSGFVWEPGVDSTVADVSRTGLGVYNLTYFVNGLPLPDRKQVPTAQGTDFPNDVNMCWFFALLNATATTPGDATLDRVRIAQML